MFVLSAVLSKIVSVYTKTTVNSLQIFNMGELNPGVFNPLAVLCLGGLNAAWDRWCKLNNHNLVRLKFSRRLQVNSEGFIAPNTEKHNIYMSFL